MAQDWDFFQSLGRPCQAVDLWAWLEGEETLSLKEVGARLVAMTQPGDLLIGYSMGARLALQGLAHDSAHWDGALLVSAHPGLASEAERAARVQSDAIWAERARSQDWTQFLQAWDGQGVLATERRLPWGDRRELEVRREAVARSFEQWSLGQQEDLAAQLGKMTCPLWWVVGEEDRKFADLGKTIEARLNQGRLVERAGRGHRLPWEAPEEFLELTRTFLSSL